MRSLSMPLKLYYTRGWTQSEIIAIMTHARQKYVDMMNVDISVLSRDRLPAGHAAETIEPYGDNLRFRKILRIHEPMPPTKLWFVDRIKFPEGDVGHSKKVYGVTPTFFLANGKPITGASVISREDHQDPDKTLNVRDCALTVAHELGHVLGLEHQCDKLKPGLMCTVGEHGVPPQFSLDEKQLKTIRNSAFLKKG